MTRLLCWLRGTHDPLDRQALGGWRCRSCGAPIADLQEAGTLPGGGYVPPVRKVYSRERGEVTRTQHWTPTRRGW